MMRYSMSVLTVAVAVAAACGGDAAQDGGDTDAPRIEGQLPAASSADAAADTAGTQMELGEAGGYVIQVRVTGDGLTMDRDTLGASGQVTFVMENGGEDTYQLHVQKEGGGQWKSLTVPPGGSIELSMVLEAGNYTVGAPLASASEAAEGMRRPLVIR